MTTEELKQCRVGRDRERPSSVESKHLFTRDGKPTLTCQRCGWTDLPQSIRDGLAKSKADAERRAR